MPALATHAASSASTGDSARQLEADVRRALLSEEGLNIASLVVRRLPNGVCLEGVIRVNSDDVDVCKSVRQLTGVGDVRNHLVVCWNCPEPSAAPLEESIF
ncbi:MAG: hypothetical protein ACK58L_00585 [Planctomycetota bacterium]